MSKFESTIDQFDAGIDAFNEVVLPQSPEAKDRRERRLKPMLRGIGATGLAAVAAFSAIKGVELAGKAWDAEIARQDSLVAEYLVPQIDDDFDVTTE